MGPCDHARVPGDFLPPDPYADAPQDAGRTVFLPPNAPASAAGPKRESKRAVAALTAGVTGLGLLVFSIGMLFVVTLPASIAGWVLGNRAKQADAGNDQANVAVIIGIVGTVFGVIAAIVWIVIVAEPE
jgi:uncharacterized membrane protein